MAKNAIEDLYQYHKKDSQSFADFTPQLNEPLQYGVACRLTKTDYDELESIVKKYDLPNVATLIRQILNYYFEHHSE